MFSCHMPQTNYNKTLQITDAPPALPFTPSPAMSQEYTEKNSTHVYTKGSVEGSDHDAELKGVLPERTLHRQLKNRHIAMISIGGVIGTGLFVGTANALRWGGPVGLLLGYSIMGTIVYSVMISLGEMIAYLPIPGGHIKLAERFVDPALSFTMGWNYWYNWIIVAPAELSASALLINYWNQSINNAVWVIMCIVVVVTINMLGAGAYGEAEFIFASIKVVTITGLIILGVVLDLGGGPSHDRIGFRYWKNPGPFVQYDGISGNTGRFLGWWAVMTQAAFSFIGTEIVAIAAGEAKNPRRNLPKAIRRVYIRILLFYIGGTAVIGLLVPSNNPDLNISGAGKAGTAAASPFVIAIETAGIKSLPSLINACLLTSAWSAASSDLYTSSRALYGLAASGNAPRIFLRTSRTGLPYVSVIFCASFTSLAFMAISSGAGAAFGWFSNMTSIAGLMTWFGISVTYLRFYAGMKAQGIDRRTLPYWTRFQPIPAWYGCIATVTICFFSGFDVFLKGEWSTATFVTTYLLFIMFPILYVGARLYYRVKPIAAIDMDFKSNIAEIEADMVDDPPPRNKWEAFWQWLI
ncbi:amino acid permease [Hygrophoropsis aurantiaca]|uniref:Amino acid permease n=1 Tax=Hygrophoropsis aurantiaca TaxID=72124 RepID=A0ACB8AP79_9AGAM|nr:amino acid permease [Hygrophoropsis aurantiaca]